jgi:hypothetical protein
MLLFDIPTQDVQLLFLFVVFFIVVFLLIDVSLSPPSGGLFFARHQSPIRV